MSEAAGAEPGPGWAEVVYGRTRLADFWWRAVPSWTERHGWLADVVAVVLGGGHGLADAPRFVLARGAAGTLVGVGCRARELDDVMHSDGRRPLFCFVGWLHPPGPVSVPGLDALEEHYVRWAAPAYSWWMTPAWEEHPSRLREPASSVAGPPPWPEPALAPAEPLEPRPGRIRVHPAAERAQVWTGAAAAAGPVALTTGWRTYRDGVTRASSDVCADDVDDTTPTVVPTPPPPTPPRTAPTGPSPTGPPTDRATTGPGPSSEVPRDSAEPPESLLSAAVGSLGRAMQVAVDVADIVTGRSGSGDRGAHDERYTASQADTPVSTSETPVPAGDQRAPGRRGGPHEQKPVTRRAGWSSKKRRHEGRIVVDGPPLAQPRSPGLPPWSAESPNPTDSGQPGPPDGRPGRPQVPGDPAHKSAGADTPPARPARAAETFGNRREVGPGSDDPDDGTFDEF